MEILNVIKEYIRPELLILVFVLYFIGIGLKKAEYVSDKHIPLILGIISIALCGIYVIATSNLNGYKETMLCIFTSITQGILVAGLSVYVNQLYKQIKEK